MSPPQWLTLLAWVSVVLAVVSAIVVALDIMIGHRQQMWIMDVVWPLTALWSGPIGLIAYYRVGRLSTRAKAERASDAGEKPPGKRKPFWQKVGLGATHCGSGCTLGDLIAETLVIAVPVTLFGHEVFGTWAVDFVLAFLLGVVFQYFTIAPMRDLGVREGLKAAVKADTASLVAWQVGMYGWMAVALFVLFSPETLPKSGPEFWFMMQVAMFAGFMTSYPVNWWLIRSGLKEAM
ncbi:MAG: DUF4396 domain-containing protein [Vicinamibacterales bacterium]